MRLSQWVRVVPRPDCRGVYDQACPHPPDDWAAHNMNASPGVKCGWCGMFAFDLDVKPSRRAEP